MLWLLFNHSWTALNLLSILKHSIQWEVICYLGEKSVKCFYQKELFQFPYQNICNSNSLQKTWVFLVMCSFGLRYLCIPPAFWSWGWGINQYQMWLWFYLHSIRRTLAGQTRVENVVTSENSPEVWWLSHTMGGKRVTSPRHTWAHRWTLHTALQGWAPAEACFLSKFPFIS